MLCFMQLCTTSKLAGSKSGVCHSDWRYGAKCSSSVLPAASWSENLAPDCCTVDLAFASCQAHACVDLAGIRDSTPKSKVTHFVVSSQCERSMGSLNTTLDGNLILYVQSRDMYILSIGGSHISPSEIHIGQFILCHVFCLCNL